MFVSSVFPQSAIHPSGHHCRRISGIANAIVERVRRSGICEITVSGLTAIRRNRFLMWVTGYFGHKSTYG